MKKVSVIMPIYNNELYIYEALESLVNLQYSDIETILVDDGSKDDSVKKIENIVSSNNDITLIVHSENRGTAQAIKTGILRASGEYIFIAAADDISLPDRITKCVNIFDEDPKIGVIVSNAEIINEHSQSTGEYYEVDPKVNNDNIALFQFRRNYCLGATMAVRRVDNILLHSNSLQLIDDYQMGLDYLLHGYNIHIFRENLVKYRIHSNNQSNNRVELSKRTVMALQSYDIKAIYQNLINRGFALQEIYCTLGIFELFRERVSEGYKYLHMADRCSSQKYKKVDILFYLGVANFKLGKLKEGLQSFLRAEEFQEYNPSLLNNIGVLTYYVHKDTNKATYYISESLRLESNYLDAARNMAALEQSGHDDKEKLDLKLTERILENNLIKRKTHLI